jgi:hypothetical protein
MRNQHLGQIRAPTDSNGNRTYEKRAKLDSPLARGAV